MLKNKKQTIFNSDKICRTILLILKYRYERKIMLTDAEIFSRMRTSVDKILERTKNDIERIVSQTEAELEKKYYKKMRDLRKLRFDRCERNDKTEINYNINQYYMNVDYTDKNRNSIIESIPYQNMRCIELKKN